MLRDLGIRWKVLAVLALPVLVLAVASGLFAWSALLDAAAAQRTGRLAAAGDGFGRLAADLQAERLATSRLLAGEGGARADVDRSRERTDASVAALNLALETSGVADLSADAATAVDRSRQAHTRLRSLRDGVDAGGTDGALADQIYTDVIRTDVDLPARIASGLSDRTLAQPLTASSLLGRVGEAAAREQLVGLAMMRSGTATSLQQRDLSVAVLDEDRALEDFRAVATSSQITALTEALTAGRVSDADLGRLRTALRGAGTASPVPVTAQEWSYVTSTRSGQLRQVAHLVAADASTLAESVVARARLRAAVAVGSVVLLVGVSVLLALVLSRRITAPLRRLTDDVTRTAAVLPGVVGKVATGQDADLPEVAVEGHDEVGALAEAFRAVNATTIEVAHEQAALRAAVGDMFVSVARRNQVLLSRQLAFIDTLERTEENPDSLENLFRLDHLATRMRRNAESLLVLAGADGGRRLREPMPLSDVVRTAISEIEHFDRVRLSATVDPPVVAHLALPTAHLVAELVENATAFSDPGAPVLVETAATRDGVRVSVRDSGIGLSAAELREANARLADAVVSDVVGSQRLGFFVVARLAAKIGARVRLQAGPGGGTVAVVDLSPVVFVPGTVAEVPGSSLHTPAADDVEDAPEVAPAEDTGHDEPFAEEPPAAPSEAEEERELQTATVAAGASVAEREASADALDRVPGLPRLVVDLDAGTTALVDPPVDEQVEEPADDLLDETAELPLKVNGAAVLPPPAVHDVDADVLPLEPPAAQEVFDAALWAPPVGEPVVLDADVVAADADDVVEVVTEAEPAEQIPEPPAVAAGDPLTDPHFVVEPDPEEGPLERFDDLLHAPLPETFVDADAPVAAHEVPPPVPEPVHAPPLPAREPLLRILPDDEPEPLAPVAPEPVAAQPEPVVPQALSSVEEPAVEEPAVEEPAAEPPAAPAATAQQPTVAVPLGARTVDVLPQQHGHRGLLRGRRAKQVEPPPPPVAEPVRRAVVQSEPPSRRSVREGIGWLPPESPELFSGNGSARRQGGWAQSEDADEERLRHAIASEALTELSRLSSYSPTVAAPASGTLTRRTPAPAPAEAAAPPAPAFAAPATGAAPLFGGAPTGAPSEPFPGSIGDVAARGPVPAVNGFPVAAPSAPSAPAAPVAPVAPAAEPSAGASAPTGLPSRVPTGATPEQPTAVLPPRPRTADGVRTTLAGFTDGARRGRRVRVGGDVG